MLAVKAKIYGVPFNQSSSIAFFMKLLVIGQRHKAPSLSALHWSPLGSLVSTGQYFPTTRVVHLPKRTNTSLITEADLSTKGTRLCGPCIAAIAGYILAVQLHKLDCLISR